MSILIDGLAGFEAIHFTLLFYQSLFCLIKIQAEAWKAKANTDVLFQ
jgi:hypothetical protein